MMARLGKAYNPAYAGRKRHIFYGILLAVAIQELLILILECKSLLSSKSGSSRTQSAYEALRAEVITCRLAPGSKLVIADLCQRFDVSLGAVREALARLTSESLIISKPQQGFRVAPISEGDLKDLTEVRIDIESQCLARAIQFGDVAWEGRLVAVFHELAHTPHRTGDEPSQLREDWAETHGRFHAVLVEACDSPWLLKIRQLLYDQSERYRRLSVPLAEEVRDINREHRDIMEATLGRDVERAVFLLRDHFRLTTRILLNAKTARADKKMVAG
jgi:DNA-binding GntR family transcriptional regulator